MPPPPTNRRIRVHLWLLLFLLLPGFHLACPGPALIPDGILSESKDEPKKPNEPKKPDEPDEPSKVPDDGGTPEPEKEAPPLPDKMEGCSPQQGGQGVCCIRNAVTICIQSIEGTGSSAAPVLPQTLPNGLPADASQRVDAKKRLRESFVLTGSGLDRVESWKLKGPNETYDLQVTNTGTDTMKTLEFVKLDEVKKTLVAGMFVLMGMVGGVQVVEAQVFLLQGEKGDTGAKGSDSGITTAEATELKKLAPEAGKLTMLASQTTVTATELTFTTESITLDASKEVKLKSPTVTLETDTFSVKAKNNTELTVDGDNRSISMSVTPSATGLKVASFSLVGDKPSTGGANTAYPLATFNAANVQVQSGSGTTDGNTNSLGNLIIGYNEAPSTPSRAGSHNLVVGTQHNYASYAGIVAGKENVLSGAYASVIGGQKNSASGNSSAVFGGQFNEAKSNFASVHGGNSNTADTSTHSSVHGGDGNTASAQYASVHGGKNNKANTKSHSSVHGGDGNTASAQYSAILGGQKETITDTTGNTGKIKTGSPAT